MITCSAFGARQPGSFGFGPQSTSQNRFFAQLCKRGDQSVWGGSPSSNPGFAKSRAGARPPWFFLSGFSSVPRSGTPPAGRPHVGRASPCFAGPDVGTPALSPSPAGSGGRSGRYRRRRGGDSGEVSFSLNSARSRPAALFEMPACMANVRIDGKHRPAWSAKETRHCIAHAGAASAGGKRQRRRGQRKALGLRGAAAPARKRLPGRNYLWQERGLRNSAM